MLKDLAYTLVFGKPLVLWLGLAAAICFSGALSVVALNNHTKIRIPIDWHFRLALAGAAIGLIHIVLAISAYI